MAQSDLHSPIRAAVVGASGYAGAELLAILANHPMAHVVGLFGSSRKADEGAPIAVPSKRCLLYTSDAADE